jgi:hypothetical protein
MSKGGLRATSFKPGVSGNPGGRPKRPETVEARKVVADVKAAARELTSDAMGALKRVMQDPKAPAAARVSAATAILDRGWGKPTQQVEANVGMTLEQLVLGAAKRREERDAVARKRDEGEAVAGEDRTTLLGHSRRQL